MSTELTTVPALYKPGQPLAEVTPQQAAWLNVVEMKNKAFAFFTSTELAAQGILTAVQNSEDQPALAEALANFTKKCTELQNARLPYTNQIRDLLIEPAMAFEKRLKELPLFATLTDKELTLRKAAAQATINTNKKLEEQTTFTLHITNEYIRIVNKYKQDLWNEIMGHYKTMLQGRVAQPDTALLFNVLDLQIKPDEIVRYSTIHAGPYLNTVEEFTTLFNNIEAPNYAAILVTAKESATHQFSNYASDLANAPAAIEHANQVQAETTLALQNEVKQEVAVNTLVTNAGAVQLEGPKIKKNLVITVMENEAWLVLVMSTFLSKRADLMKYIRAKSVSALTVKQMAEAIAKWSSETDQRITGLIYEEKEK